MYHLISDLFILIIRIFMNYTILIFNSPYFH